MGEGEGDVGEGEETAAVVAAGGGGGGKRTAVGETPGVTVGELVVGEGVATVVGDAVAVVVGEAVATGDAAVGDVTVEGASAVEAAGLVLAAGAGAGATAPVEH